VRRQAAKPKQNRRYTKKLSVKDKVSREATACQGKGKATLTLSSPVKSGINAHQTDVHEFDGDVSIRSLTTNFALAVVGHDQSTRVPSIGARCGHGEMEEALVIACAVLLSLWSLRKKGKNDCFTANTPKHNY
jgi:hypothetical protein